MGRASNAAAKLEDKRQALVDKLKYYIDNPPEYSRDLLKIRTRDLRIAPFEHNRVQGIVDRIVAKQLAQHGFVRIKFVKSRRQGISSWVQGREMYIAGTRPNARCFTVAHEADSTRTIYGIADLMQRRHGLQVPTRYHSQQQGIVYEHGSSLEIATAGSPDAARSKDVTVFHGSEVAYWPEADATMTAVMSCVPDPPVYSEVYLESTGNGFGNWFQRRVYEVYSEGARPYYSEDGVTYAWQDPDSEWVVVFFPWYASPEYAEDFPSEDAAREFRERVMADAYRPGVMDGERRRWTEERELMDRYGLSWEQLYWRNRKIARSFKGKLSKFRQEYPATLHEAFQSTGGNVFDKDLCDSLAALCKDPVFVGTLAERTGRVIARRMEHGPLSIWEGPEKPDERQGGYLVTVDPAGGERTMQDKDAKRDPDFTVMDVWRRDGAFMRQVAQWHGHIDYDVIGEESMLLARLYYRAPIAVLRMNHGLTVLASLRREEWSDTVKDSDGKQGIAESAKTKGPMVDSLLRDLRDSYTGLQCRETVEELRTFVERDRKWGAESGCKDDRVSSAYCASRVAELYPAGMGKTRDRPPEVVNFKRMARGREPRTVDLQGWEHIETM